MGLLHPLALDSVVAIGVNPDPNRRWIGTGFLYGAYTGRTEGETDYYKTFVVTNRHVVQNNEEFFVKFNPRSDQSSQDFKLTKTNADGTTNWAAHPNPNVDVAVFSADLIKLMELGMKCEFIKNNYHVFKKDEMKEAGMSEGDGIFALGFPMGILETDRQYVIVRQGCIARIRDLYENRKIDYLCDTHVFPGNSGGPIFIKPEVTAVEGTKSNRKAGLIGILKGYIPYRDEAVSRQTGRSRITFEENTGLTAVEPVDHIEETIQHFLSLRGVTLEG